MAIQYLNGINVSGDVGIGTDSPQKPLDVNGEALFRDHLFIGGYGENDSTNSIEIGRNRTGNGICFFDMTTDNTTYTDYGFRLIRWSGVNADTELLHRGTGNFNIKGQEGSNVTFSTSSSERMRINSSGNVGIGTTSPQQKLHVAGNGRFESSGTGLGGFVSVGNATEQAGNYSAYYFGNTAIDNSYFKGGIAYETLSTTNGRGDMHFLQNSVANGTNASISDSVMTILNDGNVGIGTTSPSDKLEIAAANQQLRLTDTDDSKYAQFSYSGGKLTIRNNSTTTSANQITLQENGNVGIGTTSPASKLVVEGAGEQWISVFTTDMTGAGAVNGFRTQSRTGFFQNTLYRHTGTNLVTLRAGTDDGAINFIAGGGAAERMRITSSGKVGIGTTSPRATLEIFNQSSTSDGDGSSTQTLSGQDSILLQAPAGSVEETNGSITWANGSRRRAMITSVSEALDGDLKGISFYTQGTNGPGDMFESMRIAHSGNIGIGTTSPSEKLDVNGTGAFGTGSAYALKLKSSSGARGIEISDFNGVDRGGIDWSADDFVIRNASDANLFKINYSSKTTNFYGNVGIGTTSPDGKLHIATSGESKLDIEDTGGQQYRFFVRNSDNIFGIYDVSNPLTWFRYTGNATAANTKLALLEGGGNVGIGTTSPGEKLHVSGGNLEIENNFPSLKLNSDNASGVYNQILSEKQGNSSPPQGEFWWKDGNQGGGSRWTTRITSAPYTSSYINLPHNSTGGNFAINIENNERLTIDRSNGYVGIGTTNPNYPLDVNGTVDATSFRAGGISKYTTYSSTNTYENYGVTLSNIASSPVGYLYHDLLAFNYNYTITQESLLYQGSWQSETLDKRLFSQKQDQAITVVSSGEYAVRWTIEGTSYNAAKFINLAFTYTSPRPETRVIIESSANGTTWTSRHDSTAAGITGTKSCYVSDWGSHNYVRISVLKTSNNTNSISLSSLKMMTARAGNQGDGQELQYPYVWDENRNIGLMLTKTSVPTSKLDILGATNTSSSSLLRVRTTDNPNSPEKVVGFYVNTNTERGYIAVNQYAVTYSTSSDYRLKENVVPISNGIERLKELNPCRFNFIGSNTDNVVDGFIAHEAAEVVPEAVTGEKDAVDENNNPSYQGIDQSKVVPLLTAALKEAIEKIEQLENRIQTLENN